jgi:hypothetical protein
VKRAARQLRGGRRAGSTTGPAAQSGDNMAKGDMSKGKMSKKKMTKSKSTKMKNPDDKM